MRIRIVAVGERMPRWVSDGFSEYRKRLSRDMPLDLVEVRPGRRGKGMDGARATAQEGTALLAAVGESARVVALDGRGEAWSSEQLARQLAAWRLDGRDIALMIGGADGHAPEVLARAEQRWSLGPLTLPHMLVRLVLIEQIYRAASILAGHPYHRG